MYKAGFLFGFWRVGLVFLGGFGGVGFGGFF